MTRDEIIRMAREAGYGEVMSDLHAPALERFFNAAYAAGAAAEREACAKVCDSNVHDTYIEGYTGAKHSARRECAAAIRARGTDA